MQSQLQKKGMFFVGVEREGNDKDVLQRVMQHCKRYSLPSPGIWKVDESIASQEQSDDLKKVLFHVGVNPLL